MVNRSTLPVRRLPYHVPVFGANLHLFENPVLFVEIIWEYYLFISGGALGGFR